MTKTSDTNQLGWPRWQQVLLIVLLVLIIGNRMISMVDMAAYRGGLLGEIALNAGRAIPDPKAPAGFGKMVEVDPDGPVAKAGIRNGDFVRTHLPYYFAIRPEVGDRISYTLDRGGVRSEHQIVVEALPVGHEQARTNDLLLANILAVFISILVGCFILWRGWGNTAAMLLGVALVAIGRGGSNQPPWATDLGLALPMFWLLVVFNAFVALFIPFAMRMFEQQAGSLPRWHWRLFNFWFAWCLVSLSLYSWDRFWLTTNYISWAGGVLYMLSVLLICIAVAIAYLIAAWRKGSAAERNRMTLIIFALSAYLFATVLSLWNSMQTGTIVGGESSATLIYFNALLLGIIAPGLLAYAVLRHKLLDLGFAVNRTLVFGAIGVLLLVSFALIEWAIKQAIPKVWYGGSAYISALIAVGLYLLFNRIHHSVEHGIERLFFHKWQLNEAALKRFVGAAGHMEQPEALAGHFASELARFTGGAAVAIHLCTPDGRYAGGADAIDPDDLALATMRAERGVVVPAEVGSPLDAALALPMLHQAALAGFVLLGPKPTGEDYRPDEIEVLGWATHQVGLDLQAIRVRALERSNLELTARNRTLSDILTITAPASARTANGE